jgi:hypothetical protein
VTVADDLKMAQPEGRLHDLAGAEHLVAVRHIAQLPERRGRAEPGVMVAQIAHRAHHGKVAGARLHALRGARAAR